MRFEELQTERLLLRRITPATLAFVYGSYNDDELMAFFGLESKDSLEAEREKFNKGLVTYNKSQLYFKLVDKITGKTIGWCGFHTWYLEHARAEIGYGLYNDEYKNKGLMSEALKAVIDYGFNTMKLHRIEAFIGTANPPSTKLVLNAGFTREGLLREHYRKNGVLEDSVVFSLLRNEYLNKP